MTLIAYAASTTNSFSATHFCIVTASGFYIIGKIVSLRTILFQRDGSCVLLCDCVLDQEHGLGIQVLPDYKIGSQDVFL
jgi:hypothetical protein